MIVAATDCLLIWGTLSVYDQWERLPTSSNSNGFIPGDQDRRRQHNDEEGWHDREIISKDITIQGSGKVNVKADSDIVMKGSRMN